MVNGTFIIPTYNDLHYMYNACSSTIHVYFECKVKDQIMMCYPVMIITDFKCSTHRTINYDGTRVRIHLKVNFSFSSHEQMELQRYFIIRYDIIVLNESHK